MDHFERAPDISGSADTFALDVLDEAGNYSLETIFATSSPPGKDDTHLFSSKALNFQVP